MIGEPNDHTHRIPKGNWIIEEDRRRESKLMWADGITQWHSTNKRSTPHDYSKPRRIALVDVEPEPIYYQEDKMWMWKGDSSRGICEQLENFKRVLLSHSPFSRDDILVLEAGWGGSLFNAHQPSHEELWNKIDYHQRAMYHKEPPSTMPEHLNSFTVGQVVGVERRLPADWEHEYSHCDSDKVWMFKILEKE